MLFTSPLQTRSYRTSPSLGSGNHKPNSTSNYLNLPNWSHNDDVQAERNIRFRALPRTEKSPDDNHASSEIEIQDPLHLLQRTIQQTLSDPSVTQTSTFHFYAPAAAFLGLILSLIFILQQPQIFEQCYTVNAGLRPIHENTPLAGGNNIGMNHYDYNYLFAKCTLKIIFILLSGIPLALASLRCLIFIGADLARRFAEVDLREKEEESEIIRELNQKDLFLGAFS